MKGRDGSYRPVLKIDELEQTIRRLAARIESRFPGSGLLGVCRRLVEIAERTRVTIRWINRPLYWVRILSVLTIIVFLAVLGFTLSSFEFNNNLGFWDFVQASEAGVNLLIFLTIGLAFLCTIEVRVKRARVIRALGQLGDIAHIIDMHQLTKDPDGKSLAAKTTPVSPKRTMTAFELWRYLDYCSEMLSLTSKLGYAYVAHHHDPTAAQAANDLETLTTGLSRKIWQKIMILHMSGRESLSE